VCDRDDVDHICSAEGGLSPPSTPDLVPTIRRLDKGLTVCWTARFSLFAFSRSIPLGVRYTKSGGCARVALPRALPSNTRRTVWMMETKRWE
jgi:hypothetical protein